MGKPSHGLVLSAALIAGLCGARAILVGAERAEAPRLVVIVHDQVQVFPGTLDQAVKEAARIYRQAGVATEWLTAPEPGRHTFTVQLIIQADLRVTRDHTTKFLMGAAPRTGRDCGGSVYVFHDQVVEFSSVQRIDPALAMGTVIAHEVGHLLLRQQGHSPEGLMRASLDADGMERAAMGSLVFSSPDAAAIRATLSRCRHQAEGPRSH